MYIVLSSFTGLVTLGHGAFKSCHRLVPNVDAKHIDRSYELADISHDVSFSVVNIKAKDRLIKPADIFWLGRFSAIWTIDDKNVTV